MSNYNIEDIEINISELDSMVVAEANHSSCKDDGLLYIDYSKREIADALVKYNDLKQVQRGIIEEALRTYTDAVLQMKFLEAELASIKFGEEIDKEQGREPRIEREDISYILR